MRKFIAGSLAAAACVVAFYALFESAVNAGPGCPGDPEWLGYCSEVESNGK